MTCRPDIIPTETLDAVASFDWNQNVYGYCSSDENFKTLVNDLIRSEIMNIDVPLIIPQDFQELSSGNGTTSRAVP